MRWSQVVHLKFPLYPLYSLHKLGRSRVSQEQIWPHASRIICASRFCGRPESLPTYKSSCRKGAGPLGVEPRCILRPRAFDIARCPVMHGRRALSRFRPTGRDAGRYRSEEGLTLTHIGASPPGVITWRNTGGHRPPYPFLHSPLIYQKVGCLAPKYLCITHSVAGRRACPI